MLTRLTFSLSFALALGLSGASQAGGLLHHEVSPSPQGVVASPQGVVYETCAPKKKCFTMPHLGLHEKMNGLKCGFGDLCKKMKPKPACYTYEWVLKKKKVHGGCGNSGCDTCGSAPSVYPTS